MDSTTLRTSLTVPYYDSKVPDRGRWRLLLLQRPSRALLLVVSTGVCLPSFFAINTGVDRLPRVLPQRFPTGGRQPQRLDLLLELASAAVPPEVAVHACGRSGTDEVGEPREVCGVLAGEPRMVLKPVLLMVVLREVESLVREELRVHLAVAFQERVPRLFGNALLCGVVEEESRFVLRAPAASTGVMATPEQFEQGAIRDDPRIEFDLEALGVIAKIVVSR